MSAARYNEYKDSGVPWLGEVPMHWQVKPLWTMFRRTKRVGYETETLLSVYRDFGVIPKSSRDDNFNKPSDDLSAYQLVNIGDLTINKMKAWQGSVGISDNRGIVSPAYFVYEALHKEMPRYLHYLFRTAQYTVGYLSLSKGIRVNQWDLDPQYHSRMPVLVPPLSKQKTIATFLDRETAKIDELVEEQERLIALLKEKRQAVISHVVTKGLDPAVPMKDSGIEWLGEVPEHWEIVSIKRICNKITDGAHISPDTNNGIYCFVSTRDIRNGLIDFEGCLRTSESSFDYLVRTGCKPCVGDVLFSKDGTIGSTAVVREDREFVVASSLIIMRPTTESLDSDFLNYLCQSLVVTNQVERFVKGAGLPRLSIQNLLKVIGVVPPLNEQRAISAFLENETYKHDQLITEAERAIGLLKERRSALMSAAVTGKIDVRGLVAEEVSV